MAYATSNPPVCMVPRIGSGPAIWVYVDGDAHTVVDTAEYFSDGEALGMAVNDVVIVVATGGTCTIHMVSDVDTYASVNVATLA